jgi:nucleoside-diphosphate-sugar epimerase
MNRNLPDFIETEQQLEDILSTPSDALIETVRTFSGDVVICGVAGKMGPTLAKLLRKAMDGAGLRRRIIGIARFSTPGVREDLERAGVETIACDLLDSEAVERLPDAPYVIYMAGMKFGTTGNQPLTWAMNTYVPALCARKYRKSRISALSTGNIYPLVSVSSGGCVETDMPDPVGEYAQSCLGRERIFQYFSNTYKTPVVLIRLNYAMDLRYGVLVDIALKVKNRQPISLETGYFNVIWQGDANAAIIRALTLCSSPAEILNLTGPDVISVRTVATRFGKIFGIEPIFEGTEAATAYLSNAERCRKLFGQPEVPSSVLIEWTAHWILSGGRILSKPTHFEERKGRY